MSAEAAEEPFDEAASSPYLFVDGEVNSNFELQIFTADFATGSPAFPLLLIAEFEGKSLVAVPSQAWHRSSNRRRMGVPGALSKPTAVEVLAAKLDTPQVSAEGINLKTWIGYLRADLLTHLQPYSETENCDFHFLEEDGEVYIPLAASLIAAAQDHFAFFSAQEEVAPQTRGVRDDLDGEPLGEPGEPGLAALGARMTQVESVLDFLQDGMRTLMAQQSMGQRRQPAASQAYRETPAAPTAQPKRGSMSSSKNPNPQAAGLFPHLDKGVVQAALQADVPMSSLKQMEDVVSQNVKAKKVNDVKTGVTLDPLSEHEDALEVAAREAEDAGYQEEGLPVGRTLDKLTAIMEMLTEERCKKASTSKLDAALDNVQGSGSDATSLGSGKKSAAARRALRTAFQDHPEEIYKMVERLMYEDLNAQTLPPGQLPRGLSARAWVEFRSRITAYKASAYSAWSLSGVLDSLIAGNISQARARACLGLLQIDQACIDRGNYVLAAELSLEIGPPLNALSQHVAPDIQQGEAPFSRLLDSRWAEIALGHLRDQEDYLGRRRNIGKGQNAKSESTDEIATHSPKRRPKPAAKPKASQQSSDKGQDA